MRFHVDFKGAHNLVEATPSQIQLAEIGRRLWRELFVEVFSSDQLQDWENRIPSFGCSCKKFYRDWKGTNPPDFPLAFAWKYHLKTAVNQKLSKPNLGFEDAEGLWGSANGRLD